ncbi:MAG: hypothetical protein ACR2QE_03700 [Acidimicrobiales bacterium]
MVIYLVVASMMVTIAMTAFATDIAMLYNERRNDQSLADVAALGAIQDTATSDAAVVASVKTLLSGPGEDPFTDAELDSCVVADIPSGFTADAGASCVSFNSGRTAVRVEVPTRSLGTSFAGIFGITDLDHSAWAIAGLDNPGLGNVLPFGLAADAGTFECVKVGAGNVPDPMCSGANTGNFGFLNFGLHGDPTKGTTQNCVGNGRNRVPINIAQGIDHLLSIYGAEPHLTTAVGDTDSCGTPPRPNAATTLTGNTPQVIGDGVMAGSGFPDGGPARLQRTGLLSWGAPTTSVAGHDLDDTPLWEFIPVDLFGHNVPNSCHRQQFVGETGGMDTENDGIMSALPNPIEAHLTTMPRETRMTKLLERCISHYEGNTWDDGGALSPPESPSGCTLSCSDPVFSRNGATDGAYDLWDIQYSPRFAYLPRLNLTASQLGGTTGVVFTEFEPVWIQRLYAGNCSNSGCDTVFDPGVYYSDSVTSGKVNAMTAFVFPAGILPGELDDVDAPNKVGVNQFVGLLR